MKKFIFGSMLLGGLMMTSCSDDVLEAPVEETTQKTYAQKFQEMIGGPVSRTQTYSDIQVYKLNVTVDAQADIKVYARVNTDVVYQLVGNFKDKTGSNDLEFEGPANWNDFAVEVGNEVKRTTGEAVSFQNVAASRTYVDYNTDGYVLTEELKDEDGNVVLDENNNPVIVPIEKTFTIDEIRAFGDKVPAGVNNYGRTDIAMDFKVMNLTNRKIRIYPVYWVASYRHIFGIYTYKEDGKTIDQHYDIYKSRTGAPNGEVEDLQIYKNGNWVSATNDGSMYAYSLTGKDAPTHVKSRGLEVVLPENFDGKTYGFYIKVYTNGNINAKGENYNHIWYSDTDLNKDRLPHAAYFQTEVAAPAAAVEETTTRTFLGFEDIGHGGGDKDLNDFMFIVEPEPIIINKTPIQWTLAAEDLGNIDDFDFNDVVVSLTKVAGETDLHVTALAAGGTLPVWLQYNGQTIKPEDVTGDGEFHSWFEGENTQKNGLYPMINTTKVDQAGKTATIQVPENFTLTKFMEASENNLGGFKIVVEREEGVTHELTFPDKGSAAPQMMCLPIGWKWPVERTSIITAYPEFGAWCQGYTEGETNQWAYQPVTGMVIE